MLVAVPYRLLGCLGAGFLTLVFEGVGGEGRAESAHNGRAEMMARARREAR